MKKYEYKDEEKDEYVPLKEFLRDWHKEDPRQQNPLLFEPNRADIRRINGVLTNFDSLVDEDITPPKWMLRFMAKGGIRSRDHGEPWPTNAKRSQCPRVAGMVQVICERFEMVDGHRNIKLRGEIAAHLDCTPRTVGNYLAMTGTQLEFHVDSFRWIYPEKDTPDMRKADLVEMLNTLTELTKYHYDDDELDPMKLHIPFTPIPNELVERTPRFVDARSVLRRKEEEHITRVFQNRLLDMQEHFQELMRNRSNIQSGSTLEWQNQLHGLLDLSEKLMQILLDYKSGSTSEFQNRLETYVQGPLEEFIQILWTLNPVLREP